MVKREECSTPGQTASGLLSSATEKGSPGLLQGAGDVFLNYCYLLKNSFFREADRGNDDLAGFLFTDELTGLQNRRSFRHHIEKIHCQAERKNECFSLLYIDVDQFRNLNEKFGIGAAESTLVKFAAILAPKFSEIGSIFRYAGDEFLVLLPRIDERHAEKYAEEIQEEVKNIFDPENGIRITVSIAVAVYPHHARSVHSLLQLLRRAMIECKSNGINRIISASNIQSVPKEVSGVSTAEEKTLFGRVNEMENLETAFRECEQGETRFVFITGEAGIGKSSLLKNFLQRRQKKNSFVFSNVDDGTKHHANSVLRSAIKNGIDSNAIVSHVVSLLPQKDRNLLFAFEHSPKTNSEKEDQDLFRAIEVLLKTITKVGPTVLALDDVQTDDALVLSVLQFLARECQNIPLLVIAVVRKDTEISPILNWFIQTMTQSGSFNEINLHPLSLDQCASMVSATFGGRCISARSLDLIYNETLGNPLSIEEFTQLIVEEGLIVLTDGVIDIGKTDRTLIPNSLRELVLRRIKNLSEAHQYILGLSAVIGYEFDPNFISSMLRECGKYREEMIEELIQMQFFRKSDKGRVDFFNERMRRLIYEEMGKANRKMFHERIAQELEKLNQADPKKWPELAHHFARMGNLAKTMQYLTQIDSPINVTSEIKTN